MTSERPPDDELAYIRYSAKEILFHLTSKVEALEKSVHNIELHMVTRSELTATRRWAVGATIAACSALIAALNILL